jgi:DNA-binding transcriptional regulator GbsR (MarR family)
VKGIQANADDESATASPARTAGDDSHARLTPFQQESVSFFVHVASAVSMPKSIGEIYGLLFSTRAPLSLDDIVERLRMSRGSASEGTRWLRKIGAVQLVCRPGWRKDHFTAETGLRKLASGILREQIAPHVENGNTRLQVLGAAIDPKGEDRDFESGRVSQLSSWYRFARRALPIVKALAGKF